jgi:hypothetical protein
MYCQKIWDLKEKDKILINFAKTPKCSNYGCNFEKPIYEL